MEDVRDKVVIITGASSGIGEGIAYHLASRGSKLSLVARNKEKLINVVENCIKKGLPKEKVTYTIGDLTEDAVRRELINSTVSAFGVIDVLINNAGIAKLGPIADVSEEEYRRVLEVNQTTPYLLTQLAVPHLKKSKGGNVISISSIAGNATPYVGFSVYSMTKAALNIFSKFLAIELAKFDIRSNTISPGIIKTNINGAMEPDEEKRNARFNSQIPHIPVGRLGTPKDIAEAVVFLITATWITGENMIVDGGRQLFTKLPEIEQAQL